MNWWPCSAKQDVDWSLRRLCELGVAHEVHPNLATDDDTVDLVKRLDALVQELEPGRRECHLALATWLP